MIAITGITGHSGRYFYQELIKHKYKEKILPANFSCLILQTLNQNDINHQLGRTGGDEILAYLSSCLRSLFKENVFLGYNGSGQFMIFVQNGNYEELKSLINNLHILKSIGNMDYNGCITAEDIEKLGKEKIYSHAEEIAKTTFVNAIIDCHFVEKFDVD